MRPLDHDYEVCDIAIQVGAAMFFNDLDIVAGSSDAYREEYEPTAGMFQIHTTPFPAMSPGCWHHIFITIDLATAQRTFEVDQVVQVTGPAMYPMHPAPSGSKVVSTTPAA